MWAACRPDSTPERTKRFRFGGPKTELVYRVNERGCAAVQAREVTGIHGSCLEYKLNQGSKLRRKNPHQRSKANSALTSVAPFDCTHGVAAPRADVKQQCEVSLCIEWILRGPCEGAVQPGAATSAAPLSGTARLELSSVERLPRFINLGK